MIAAGRTFSIAALRDAAAKRADETKKAQFLADITAYETAVNDPTVCGGDRKPKVCDEYVNAVGTKRPNVKFKAKLGATGQQALTRLKKFAVEGKEDDYGPPKETTVRQERVGHLYATDYMRTKKHPFGRSVMLNLAVPFLTAGFGSAEFKAAVGGGKQNLSLFYSDISFALLPWHWNVGKTGAIDFGIVPFSFGIGTTATYTDKNPDGVEVTHGRSYYTNGGAGLAVHAALYRDYVSLYGDVLGKVATIWGTTNNVGAGESVWLGGLGLNLKLLFWVHPNCALGIGGGADFLWSTDHKTEITGNDGKPVNGPDGMPLPAIPNGVEVKKGFFGLDLTLGF